MGFLPWLESGKCSGQLFLPNVVKCTQILHMFYILAHLLGSAARLLLGGKGFRTRPCKTLLSRERYAAPAFWEC